MIDPLGRMLLRVVFFVLLGSCALNPFLPDLRTADDRARELAPRCARRSDATDIAAISPRSVETVQAAYSYVASGSERFPHLRGARLRLAPEASPSAEALERALRCHQVRVVMGAAPDRSDDPYALPKTWLEIDAESTGDGFAVAVRVDDYQKAREILARAQRFAAPQP